MSEVREKATLAKQAAHSLSMLSTAQKNEALLLMADALIAEQDTIMDANKEDLQQGKERGTNSALLDRLSLDPSRIKEMADGLRQVAELTDPIGEVLEEVERPNGLFIKKLRVPLGVIGMIYEARPNVTVDATGLCLKTGNAVLLRGSASALNSNLRIVEVLHRALGKSTIPVNALQLISNPHRSSVDEMLKLNGLLDVIIPRGGHGLIQNVVRNATVPVIETGAGVCHTYIDSEANIDTAANIAINAKVQRPSVCNAMETLLVHKEYAEHQLDALSERYRQAGVELRGCPQARALVSWMKEASVEDWSSEYNDSILAVKVVSDIDEALAHIRQYGTMHSECIVTDNKAKADRFLLEVDAAAVYHNASTRFTDGFEFGLGAEIGISTQKLHTRGPMGLPALTTTKYCVYGTGQIK